MIDAERVAWRNSRMFKYSIALALWFMAAWTAGNAAVVLLGLPWVVVPVASFGAIVGLTKIPAVSLPFRREG